MRLGLAAVVLDICLLTGLGCKRTDEPKHYVPKSKCSTTSRLSKILLTAVNDIGKSILAWVEFRIEDWKVKRRVRRALSNLGPARKHTRFRRDFSSKLPSRLAVMVVLAMEAGKSMAQPGIPYDTDSGPIGIDNRCTACISHRVSDFEGPLTDVNFSIRGFAGSRTSGLKRGTLVWRWEDDEGQLHKFTIPKSYYVPAGNVRLLSPQHMAQAMKDPEGTGEETNGKRCKLYWNKRKHTLTIPLDENNVATFSSAPAYTAYQIFCQEAGFDGTKEYADPLVMQSVVTDDEPSDDEDEGPDITINPTRNFKTNGSRNQFGL